MLSDRHQSRAAWVAVAALVLAACSKEEADEAVPVETPEPIWLSGSYSGEFPCVDCPGIETRLWLRPDRVFFYRQRYRDADDPESGAAFYAMGQWRWDSETAAVALERDGPVRWFDPVAEGTLQFRTSAQPEHLLQREPLEAPFPYTVTLEGEYAPGEVQRLTECRTRLSFAIVDEGEGRRIRRQYRSMPRGESIVAVVEGHMIVGDEGALSFSVDRLVTLKPGERC